MKLIQTRIDFRKKELSQEGKKILGEEERQERLELRELKENLWSAWRGKKGKRKEEANPERNPTEESLQGKLDRIEEIRKRLDIEIERRQEKERDEWRQKISEKDKRKMRQEKKKQLEEAWKNIRDNARFIETCQENWKIGTGDIIEEEKLVKTQLDWEKTERFKKIEEKRNLKLKKIYKPKIYTQQNPMYHPIQIIYKTLKNYHP